MKIAEPLQARSRETYERLLDSAEELLGTEGYETVSIQRITADAGYTVGAFYARFPSKEALLWALEERVGRLVRESLDRLANETAAAETLEEVVTAVVELLAWAYRERGSLLLSLRAAAGRDAALADRLDAMNNKVVEVLVEILDRSLGEGGPRRRVGLETAVLMLTSAMRELVLQREYWPQRGGLATAAIEEELPVALTAYLETLR